MKKRGKKAQAAMEYLLTYGWAILIVIIVLSLLFYLDVFSPKSSGTCVITAPFVCRDYMVNENSVGALLSGKDVSSVTVNSIIVNGKECTTSEPDGMGGQIYTDTALSNIEYGGQAWVRCVGIDNNIGEKISVDIDLDYVSEGGLQHTITGYVSSPTEPNKGTFDYTHVIDNNIVLSYDFENIQGDTIYNLFPIGINSGTKNGDVTCINTNGKQGVGTGLGCFFDGDGDYINVLNSPSLGLTEDFTLMLWVNPGGYIDPFPAMIAKGDTGYALRFFSESGYQLYTYAGGGNTLCNLYATPNVWNFVAMVYRDNTVDCYINELSNLGVGLNSGGVPSNPNSVTIGRSNVNREFKGNIDSVVIYNRVLSQGEIKDHYCYTEHTTNPTFCQ